MNKFEKPKVATVYREKGREKLVLMIPGRYIREVAVLSHESLSVLRKWCFANGYKIDESRLERIEYKEKEEDWYEID